MEQLIIKILKADHSERLKLCTSAEEKAACKMMGDSPFRQFIRGAKETCLR